MNLALYAVNSCCQVSFFKNGTCQVFWWYLCVLPAGPHLSLTLFQFGNHTVLERSGGTVHFGVDDALSTVQTHSKRSWLVYLQAWLLKQQTVKTQSYPSTPESLHYRLCKPDYYIFKKKKKKKSNLYHFTLIQKCDQSIKTCMLSDVRFFCYWSCESQFVKFCPLNTPQSLCCALRKPVDF